MVINNGFKWIKTAALFVLALLIWLFAAFPGMVEDYYAEGFYPWFSSKLRFIEGRIPFSVGDVLYAWAGIWLIMSFIKLVIVLFSRKWNRDSFLNSLRRNLNRLLRIYIVFNIFWGLNYDRLGIAYQLRIEPAKYDTADLKQLTAELILKVNDYKLQSKREALVYAPYSKMFLQTEDAYRQVEKSLPFLHYQNRSIKRSLYSRLGNYLGFLGYYNPFTGEAQVNVKTPDFLQPYVTCHEVAHQLGYASESEANFAGYLAARSSTDKLFNYSVYFDLFNYANNELFYRDSAAARANYRQLDTLVKLDIRAYRKYLQEYKNPAEPVIRFFYSNYLKANRQPKGIDSYNEVVAWLIAYKKKYGVI